MSSWNGRLATVMRKRGCSQVALAAACGTSQPVVSDWLRRKRRPTVKQLDAAVKHLEVADREALGYGYGPAAVVDLEDDDLSHNPDRVPQGATS